MPSFFCRRLLKLLLGHGFIRTATKEAFLVYRIQTEHCNHSSVSFQFTCGILGGNHESRILCSYSC